jgi:hypothetical protein
MTTHVLSPGSYNDIGIRSYTFLHFHNYSKVVGKLRVDVC